MAASFWILDDIAPLREASATLANSAHLFSPAPAYRIQRDTNTDTPLPPDEPAGANPPDGAILDYYLPAAATTVTLEILDAQGHLVRSFSNSDKPDITEEELQKQLIPLYWVREPRHLSTAAGMHRLVWDLHYPPPAQRGMTIRSPRFRTTRRAALSVRLCCPEPTSPADRRRENFTAPLTVKMDPRVKTSIGRSAEEIPGRDALGVGHDRIGAGHLQAGSIRAQLEKLSPVERLNQGCRWEPSKKNSRLAGRTGRISSLRPPRRQRSAASMAKPAPCISKSGRSTPNQLLLRWKRWRRNGTVPMS